MKYLNFGSLNIDKVYGVCHFVKAGETIASHTYQEYTGGKGLNQSIALAKAGLPIFHAGKIGSDGFQLEKQLHRYGVDTQYLFHSCLPSGHAIIQVDDHGENCILLYGGANHDLQMDEIVTVFDDFDEGDCLFLQNEINHMSQIINLAYQKGMRIVLNPSPIDQIKETVDFHKISDLILNETEGSQLTNQTDPMKILEELVKVYPHLKIVLTLGSKGALYKDKETCIYQKSYPCKVIDTTGAGDTFLGYFYANLLKTSNIQMSLEIASKAASVAVRYQGAFIPDMKDIQSIKWDDNK